MWVCFDLIAQHQIHRNSFFVFSGAGFTKNTYEVKIKENYLESNNLYDVITTQKKTNYILLKDGIRGKKALDYINNNYEVLSFKVEHPTIEEIFIKSVKDE